MKKSRGLSSCLDWVSDYTSSLVTNQGSDSILTPAKFGVAKWGKKGFLTCGDFMSFLGVLGLGKGWGFNLGFS
jgi:hypothetical protein